MEKLDRIPTKRKKQRLLGCVVVFFCLVVSIFPIKSAVAENTIISKPIKQIVLRSTFTTEFSSSNAERKHNIRLACSKIKNVIVDVGKEFSFNRAVGERTVSRGFKSAKIIKDGTFIDGVGGGVCQVSTTLYNAVILSDLKITEYHPHSLCVSYVEPSFDAMVNSGSADLRFVNDTGSIIIIDGNVSNDRVTFYVYGEKMNCTIRRESTVTERGELPETEIVYSEEIESDKWVSYPRAYTKSRGVTVKIKNGKEYRKILRKDYYKEIKGVLIKKMPENN